MSKSNQSFFISRIQSQQGAALILFFMVILLTGAIFVISSVSMDDSRIENEEKTTQSLARAKEALIAYAMTKHFDVTNSDRPRTGAMGFLPCQEDSASVSEGSAYGTCAGSQYQSKMGRLPWKTLGIEPLKDGSGSCLWYAVSSEYMDSGGLDRGALGSAVGLSRTEMLNDDSNGSFILEDRNGNVIKGVTPSERIVGVVIAPGKPLAGQVRTNDGSQCGGDNDATHFMEVFNGVNNTTVTATDDFIDTFVASDKSNDNIFNDRIITITQQEIFAAIKQTSEFNDLVDTTTNQLADCVAEFGLQNPPAGGGGGGCDVPACRAQCVADQTACIDQCAPARTSCRFQCTIDWWICRLSGERANICAAARNACRSGCDTARDTCEANCNTTFGICDANCDTCGGAGGADSRLPWPAAMDLGGFDYRVSENYIEDDASGIHLGRFPVDVTSTTGLLTNPGTSNYLLEKDYGACANFNTDAITVGGVSYNSRERRFWENWKDHFFYAVAGDFDASPANSPTPTPGTCANCLTVDGNGPFSAVIIFTDERINNQVRDTTPDTDTKDIIGNYLEGDNIDGDTTYETNITNPAVNDIAYCIDESMQVSDCQP